MRISRRKAVKLGSLAALLAAAGGTVACSRENVVSWAGVVIAELERAAPLLKSLVPASAAILDKAILVAHDLEAALKAGSVNTVDLIEQLIAPGGLLSQIITDLNLIPDPVQRNILSGGMILAGIALRLISAALKKGTPRPILAQARQKNRAGVAVVEQAAQYDLTAALAALKF
jgi:hypothetical protein